jgi:starch synthase
MADVVGALPGALGKLGVESVLFTPSYPQLCKLDPGPEIAAFDVWVSQTPHRAAEGALLVDLPAAYDRPGVYDDPRTAQGFADSLFRCVVLQQAARIAVRDGHVACDVVHCHDNHTGLLPVYLKDDGGPPSVYTIHNLAYQGIYPRGEFWATGLHTDRFFGHSAFEFYGDLSLMKAGLSFAPSTATASTACFATWATASSGS